MTLTNFIHFFEIEFLNISAKESSIFLLDVKMWIFELFCKIILDFNFYKYSKNNFFIQIILFTLILHPEIEKSDFYFLIYVQPRVFLLYKFQILNWRIRTLGAKTSRSLESCWRNLWKKVFIFRSKCPEWGTKTYYWIPKTTWYRGLRPPLFINWWRIKY